MNATQNRDWVEKSNDRKHQYACKANQVAPTIFVQKYMLIRPQKLS